LRSQIEKKLCCTEWIQASACLYFFLLPVTFLNIKSSEVYFGKVYKRINFLNYIKYRNGFQRKSYLTAVTHLQIFYINILEKIQTQQNKTTERYLLSQGLKEYIE